MNSCTIPVLGHWIDYWLNYCGSTERSLITRNRKLVPLPIVMKLLNMFLATLLWPWSTVQLKSSVFLDITPCSSLKVNRRFRRTCCLRVDGKPSKKTAWSRKINRPADQQTQWPINRLTYEMLKWVRHGTTEIRLCWLRFACYFFHAGFLPGFPSTVKMKKTCFSKTSFDFERTRAHHIPEDWTLHNNRCENLKSWLVGSYLLSEPSFYDDVVGLEAVTRTHDKPQSGYRAHTRPWNFLNTKQSSTAGHYTGAFCMTFLTIASSVSSYF
jgi:hypothetical protein